MSRLNKPSITSKVEFNMLTDEPCWMDPILEFLKSGVLPDDHKKARKIQTRSNWYIVYDDVLYKQAFSQPLLRCQRPSEAAGAIEDVHKSFYGSHQAGQALVQKLVRQGYYFPNIVKRCKEGLMGRSNDCYWINDAGIDQELDLVNEETVGDRVEVGVMLATADRFDGGVMGGRNGRQGRKVDEGSGGESGGDLWCRSELSNSILTSCHNQTRIALSSYVINVPIILNKMRDEARFPKEDTRGDVQRGIPNSIQPGAVGTGDDVKVGELREFGFEVQGGQKNAASLDVVDALGGIVTGSRAHRGSVFA
ncbi:hypothetical protein NE237_000452 [Protea cynaroides]|uniref:Reverse transcriptase n=1 Tax=Protea cynaroides TaxID=273540 RepID=A0A9Q0KS31_9MAGN|nr:hypothetical protein NE237_000452 [Protea cynaroides]